MKNNQIEKIVVDDVEKNNLLSSNEFLLLKKFFDDIKKFDEYVDSNMKIFDVVL